MFKAFTKKKEIEISKEQYHINIERMKNSTELMQSVVMRTAEVVLDKDDVIRLILCGLFSGGHILLEDVPGVGKTTMAKAISIALGLNFGRVQFTSDLLPSDITGTTIFDRNSQEFRFHKGAVFSQVLLADEINRASPKTQSSLLEAMEERTVTVDNVTHALPWPFLVIATQNPTHHSGTHALPESQLDRFIMNLSIGYPSEEAQIEMLMGVNPKNNLDHLQPAISENELKEVFACVDLVHVSKSVAQYIHRIAERTRDRKEFAEGLGPRSLLGLIQACKAWALMSGSTFVTPEHVKYIYPWVAAHRLKVINPSGVSQGPEAHKFHAQWITKIPSENNLNSEK